MSRPRNHILKFNRASTHLNELYRRLSKWFEDGNHTVWHEDDPNAPNQILLKATVADIPADPFSLLIGDIVQNFRACLDHLAYDLASIHTKPLTEDIARDSQFPIIGDIDRRGQTSQGPTMFSSQRKSIRGIHPGAQAEIERLQPYHRGNGFGSDPLWWLSSLSNMDKHRIPHIAAIFHHVFALHPGANARFPVITIRNAIGHTFETTGARVERDTVIARIGVTRSDDPEMNVKIEITPSVAFADGVFVNEDILTFLATIQTHISGCVLPALNPFLP